MIEVVVRGLLRLIALLLIGSLLAFAIPSARPHQFATTPSAATLPERYASFVVAAAGGDFGVSFQSARPVSEMILASAPATLELTALALAGALALAVPAAVLVAMRRRWRAGRIVLLLSVLAAPVPPLLSGSALLFVFATRLALVPGIGANDGAAADSVAALALPVVTLALFQAAPMLRVFGQGLATELDSGVVRFARSRGLPRPLVARHALANALVPLVTTSAQQFASLLAGVLVAEGVFGRPGIGKLLLDSILTGDDAVLAALVLLAVPLFLAVDLAGAALCYALDPRLRPPRAIAGLAS